MHDYPIISKLKDSTPVAIRPVSKEDKDCIKMHFRLLSEKSRYYRFFSHQRALSEKQLRYLTETDTVNHFAICAHDVSRDNHSGVGIARYIRLVDNPSVAECAIVIMDAYQNRGAGTLLLYYLMEAALFHGIRRFRGYTLAENRMMMNFLRRFDAQVQVEDGFVLRAEVSLPILENDEHIHHGHQVNNWRFPKNAIPCR